MYDYRRGEGAFVAFLVGGVLGAVLGLLFSPRSGRENRELIAAKADELMGEGREFYETSRAKVSDESEELRAKIDAARERLKEQVDEATAQAKSKVHEVAPAAREAVEKVGATVLSGVETAEAKAMGALDRLSEKTAPAEGDAPADPIAGA